ncbi:unnamed protein product [Linum tenue]|uniref:Hydroxyproline-rich glycoprotein family protein n=1 Tax=Linum tenue TaxID=586396 RepID=A0AAV0L8U5_9ROSI|nr:unnamed protein product [Linum tenue]
MDAPDLSPPPHVDASRPSLGFPLGTALLLVVIFSLSGIFSCCYHWDKLRSLRRRLLSPVFPSPSRNLNSFLFCFWLGGQDVKQSKGESLPVVMPGDQIAKFIALPCPCQPARAERVLIKVEKKPPSKPPRIAVPFY